MAEEADVQRHPVVTTGVVVGLGWGLWHLPLFWARDSFAGVLPLAILAAQLFAWLPAFRVLMVWVGRRVARPLPSEHDRPHQLEGDRPGDGELGEVSPMLERAVRRLG